MNLLELVPRQLSDLVRETAEVRNRFPQIQGFNIPDVLRLPTRSYEAVSVLLKEGHFAIPHIRCIDHPAEHTLGIIGKLVGEGLKAVLLVSGDPPRDPAANTYPVSPVTLCEAVKHQFPDLTVYCGLDPYRVSFREELAYCAQKQAAGADGFFSQPFFEESLADLYLDQLTQTALFVGISPVISEQSYNYWITKNHAVFPPNFPLTLEFACTQATHLIRKAEQRGQHTYLMPIKVPAITYLEGIFPQP